MYRIVRQLIRPAADLAALANFLTPPFEIFGAVSISVFARATNANALSAQSFEIAPEDLVTSPNTWFNPAGQGITSLTSLASFNLSAGGFTAQAYPTTIGRPFPWRACRVNVTGHATLIVAGLELWAVVIFPKDMTAIESAAGSVLT